MKKCFAVCVILIAFISKAQSYSALDKILDKLEAKQKKLTDASDYNIQNKKFVLLEDFDDHSERHILDFGTDNKVTLIELIDDKATEKTYSNIFTGDYIRKKNAVSVRANFLEGKQIALPLVYSLYLMNAKDVWYLKDINTGKRWIENNNLLKKKK